MEIEIAIRDRLSRLRVSGRIKQEIRFIQVILRLSQVMATGAKVPKTGLLETLVMKYVLVTKLIIQVPTTGIPHRDRG